VVTRPHDLRRRLHDRSTVVGGLLKLVDEGLVEALARSGCDFVAFDVEHSDFSPQDIRHLAYVATMFGISPVLRGSVKTLSEYADRVGPWVAGFQLARATSAAELTDAVSSLLYAPEGVRGVALGPPTGYSPADQLVDWTAAANERLAIIAQLETPEILLDIDSALAIGRLDCFYVGEIDLAAASGWDSTASASAVRSAKSQILGASRALGVARLSNDEDQQWDASYVIFPVEPVLLTALADVVATCRAALQTVQHGD